MRISSPHRTNLRDKVAPAWTYVSPRLAARIWAIKHETLAFITFDDAETTSPVALAPLAILTERAPVTPEMALRLGKLCGDGPELWLNLQSWHKLERLSQTKRAEIAAIPTLAAE